MIEAVVFPVPERPRHRRFSVEVTNCSCYLLRLTEWVGKALRMTSIY